MAGKEALAAGAKKGRDWAEGRWAEFRAESPYFQAKVGLGVAYAVIVVLTILLAPPRGITWQSSQERIPFGLAFKTAVLLKNLRAGDLDDVTIEIKGEGIEFDGRKVPGAWHTRPMNLPEGREAKILTENLYDDQNVNPPYSLVVDSLKVVSKKKKTIVELHPKQTGVP